MNLNTIGERLRYAIQLRRLKISEIVRLAGLQYATVQKYLSDKRTPMPEPLAALCDVLNVNMEWVTTGRGSMYRRLAQPDTQHDVDEHHIEPPYHVLEPTKAEQATKAEQESAAASMETLNAILCGLTQEQRNALTVIAKEMLKVNKLEAELRRISRTTQPPKDDFS